MAGRQDNPIVRHPGPNAISSNLADLNLRKVFEHIASLVVRSAMLTGIDDAAVARIFSIVRGRCVESLVHACRHSDCTLESCQDGDVRSCRIREWEHAYEGELCNTEGCQCKPVRLGMEHVILCMDSSCTFFNAHSHERQVAMTGVKDKLMRMVLTDIVTLRDVSMCDAIYRVVSISAADHRTRYEAPASQSADTHEGNYQ